MRTTLFSLASVAGMIVGLGANTATAASVTGLKSEPTSALIQKADWDDRDRGWGHNRWDRDDGGWRHRWWWWHHRHDRGDRRWDRDRDDWRRHHDRNDWR
jgi:hypothetical protein